MDSIERREYGRVGVHDMVLLEDYTSQEAFLGNLRKRFKENIIYTYIGSVLVSVNPYKQLPIYKEKFIDEYQKRHLFEAPPHIFAITNAAYSSLSELRKDQCILISGESGSGKTEASKKVLQFIAAASGHKRRVEGVKDKLVQSNPVLEAFGNAKTNRNDNSSRFGKYMDIMFDYTNEPIGGNITNYLLEKSRVVNRTSGERNFHIFYQLLYGVDDDTMRSLLLTRDVQDYTYLRQEHPLEDANSDRLGYEEVKRAMCTMELSSQEQCAILRIIAGILHLGNVTFSSVEDISFIQNMQAVEYASLLFSCAKTADLANALTHRSIEARGDVVSSKLNKDMAVYARDALAKAIYDRLFTWLVSRINRSLQMQKNPKQTAVMGILDIYGFEVFQKNGFEQFCINYCNEKLQQLFVELTLRSEQEEYEREGIEWETIQYFDNKVICNLIEEKHKGIISLLDEECLRPGDTSDMTFLNKITEQLSGHKHFVSFKSASKDNKKKIGREEFQLVHYAGEVTYDVSGFLEKNNDLLFRDLTDVIASSDNIILQDMFQKVNGCKKRPETAITQFKTSLSRLMDLLKTKEPSYIRCIKPNDFKLPGVFDEQIINHQIRYLGLMENVRLRRAGFAYRHKLESFLHRYKCLCPLTWPFYRGPAKYGVIELLTHLGYSDDQYRIGNTKVFIRYSKTLFEIEDAFQAKKHFLVAKIQATWRAHVVRKRYIRMRTAAIVMQSWIRRFIAQRTAERRRNAVTTIRNFIKGYITRREPPNGFNNRFIRTSKIMYLLRLSKSLPQSVLVNTWPVAPTVCREASQHLRRLHKRWLSRKYRLALSEERKKQLELKVLAESLFKGKKKSYLDSVGPKFLEDRLSTQQKELRDKFIRSNLYEHEQLLYSCPVAKFDRHGYKRRDRVLVITKRAFYLLQEDSKSMKMKHRFPFKDVCSLEVTSEYDNFLLLKISPELKNDKGDLILEVPYLIECITRFIDHAKPSDLLHINSLENGMLTHNLIGQKSKPIDIIKGDSEPCIIKGKSGNLIVVG